MKKILLTLVFVVSSLCTGFAQYNSNQNKIWVFGERAGLDFNSGTPVSFVSNMWKDFFEGSAQVSDAAGNLLFYTDGRTVYNRAGAIMLHGDSIVNFETRSSVHSAVIVSVTGNSNQYYIFSLEQWEGGHGRLAYSLVDMTLDSGFGAVLPSVMGVVIDSQLSEKMITIPGNSCNMWVLCHKLSSNVFRAFSVTGAGVAPAVSSAIGPCSGMDCYLQGSMRASPDGQKIALNAFVQGTDTFKTILCDFNQSTGIVSNDRIIDIFNGFAYGMEFSPDNTKLYQQETRQAPTNPVVTQFDVSLPSTAAISASRTNVDTAIGFEPKQMRLGPDGKIYMHPDRIENPNLPGAACNYVHDVIDLSPRRASTGLPSLYNNPSVYVSGGAVCLGGNLTVTSSPAGGTWVSSNPAVASIDAAGVVTGLAVGTAAITYTSSGCHAVTVVSVVAMPDPVGGLATACVGHTTVLSSATSGGSWTSGNLGVATVNAYTGVVTGITPGTAVITYSLGSGCAVEVKTVNVIASLPPITCTDSVLCVGESALFSNAIPGGMWTVGTGASISTTGIVTPVFMVGTAIVAYSLGGGCYVEQVITINCTTTSLADVATDGDNGIRIFPNPTHDNITIKAAGTIGNVAISNLLGQRVFSAAFHSSTASVSLKDLPPGLYVVKINEGRVYKVLKE